VRNVSKASEAAGSVVVDCALAVAISPRLLRRRQHLYLDPLHRLRPNPERASRLEDARPGGQGGACSAIDFLRNLGPPEPLALRPGALQAGLNALADHAALILRERAGDLKEQTAVRRRRVEVLLVEVEVDPDSADEAVAKPPPHALLCGEQLAVEVDHEIALGQAAVPGRHLTVRLEQIAKRRDRHHSAPPNLRDTQSAVRHQNIEK
jgi:hypothetical protein